MARREKSITGAEFRRRWRENDWADIGARRHTVTANRIEFVVPGKPQPKQRARRNSRTGKWYTPTTTVLFENRVIQHFIVAAPRHVAWTGPVAIGVTAYGAHHAADSSNIRKAVEDALNKVAYRDDVQIQDAYDGKRPVDDKGQRTVIVLMRLDTPSASPNPPRAARKGAKGKTHRPNDTGRQRGR
jgi:Holliday junction resolvase RusA-like endonuclease